MENLVKHKETDLLQALNIADNIVNKKYLTVLNDYPIVQARNNISSTEINKISRFYKLEQFVFDKSEDTRDKLVSVFQSVASVNASLVFIINSNKEKIDYYIGVKSFDKNPNQASDLLYKSLNGNFPGIVFSKYEGMKDKNAIVLSKKDLTELEANIFERGKNENTQKSVSAITGIAGLRAERSVEYRFIQGIERVADAMQGEQYTLMIIADPISNNNLLNLQRNYENLYSAIKPFETTDLTFGENESRSVTQSYSQSISETINTSIANALSTTDTTSVGDSKTFGGNLGICMIGGVNGSVSTNTGVSYSQTESETKTTGETHTISDTNSFSDSDTKGTSKSVQIKFENKAISEILKKIDLQLERLQSANDVGMWNVAAYAIADNEIDSKTVAASYQSIIRGENSGIENSSITTWKDENLINAKEYLRKLCHPLINFEGKEVQSSSLVTSKELAIHAGFPEKRVAGFGVKNLASFG